MHIRKHERIWLSFKKAHTVKNIAKGTTRSLGALGLAIDLFGDYNAVMVDVKGSRNVMELFGRTGVSVAAAGVGVVVVSIALASVIASLVAAGTAPIWSVLIIGALTVVAVGAGVSYVSGKVKDAIF